ncbi:MAG: hypothetical protein JW946_02195 [Candidatus Omnitrophica bacterium]|nr:hypothetical protein [Candidatus Omnitrophota bacterium]
MSGKRSRGLTIFSFALVGISMIFINIAIMAKATVSLYGIEKPISIIAVLGWLVPALLGFGLLRLNNFFRITTICISALVIMWTPVMFFYLRGTIAAREAGLPVFSKYEFIDLFLLLFSIYSIYFLNRPKVKEQFKETL